MTARRCASRPTAVRLRAERIVGGSPRAVVWLLAAALIGSVAGGPHPDARPPADREGRPELRPREHALRRRPAWRPSSRQLRRARGQRRRLARAGRDTLTRLAPWTPPAPTTRCVRAMRPCGAGSVLASGPSRRAASRVTSRALPHRRPTRSRSSRSIRAHRCGGQAVDRGPDRWPACWGRGAPAAPAGQRRSWSALPMHDLATRGHAGRTAAPLSPMPSGRSPSARALLTRGARRSATAGSSGARRRRSTPARPNRAYDAALAAPLPALRAHRDGRVTDAAREASPRSSVRRSLAAARRTRAIVVLIDDLAHGRRSTQARHRGIERGPRARLAAAVAAVG